MQPTIPYPITATPNGLSGSTVLVVDDVPTNLAVLSEYLKDYDINVLVALDGPTALQRAELVRPDIILLDVMMPGMDGFEVCTRLKADERLQEIPVIFMTALADVDNKVKGFETGAVDYVTKPVQQAEVLARLRTHLALRRLNEELERLVAQRTTELQQALAQLRILDQKKTDFLVVTAHELRTPLTAIRGYAQLLVGEKLPPEVGQMRQGIVSSADRLTRLVGEILDMARLDMDTSEPILERVKIAEIVQAVLRDFSAGLQERLLEVQTSGLEGLPAISGDPELLHKVFYHLVGNAIKWTPDGGKVVISWKAETFQGLARRCPEFIEGVEIAIADSGIGIAPEHQAMIFEKFFRVDGHRRYSSSSTHFKGGGPGLGLAIAKGIVTAHGGRIWVESAGCDEAACPGSVFHVWLPVGDAIGKG